nr:hypothetical protein [Microlunatus sp. Gsoil 973]
MGIAFGIGHPVQNPVGGCGLARGRIALGPEGVRLGQCAGCIDHRASPYPFHRVNATGGSGGDLDDERMIIAAGVDQQVTVLAGHSDHPVAEPDPVVHRRRQRGQVPVHPVSTGRVDIAVGDFPPGRFEQGAPCGRGQLGPGGEQSHMAPGADSGGRLQAGLQDQDVLIAAHQLGGSRQTHGSRAQHDHRQTGVVQRRNDWGSIGRGLRHRMHLDRRRD